MIIRHDFRDQSPLPLTKVMPARPSQPAVRNRAVISVGFSEIHAGIIAEQLPGPIKNLSLAEFQQVLGAPKALLCVRLLWTPVMGRYFDVIDMAQKLRRSGFCGKYRAVINFLPDRQMVVDEVRQISPRLDFDVVELADHSGFYRV